MFSYQNHSFVARFYIYSVEIRNTTIGGNYWIRTNRSKYTSTNSHNCRVALTARRYNMNEKSYALILVLLGLWLILPRLLSLCQQFFLININIILSIKNSTRFTPSTTNNTNITRCYFNSSETVNIILPQLLALCQVLFVNIFTNITIINISNL